jgi:hypothetical protein
MTLPSAAALEFLPSQTRCDASLSSLTANAAETGDRAFTGVLAGFPVATNARKRASEWPLSPEGTDSTSWSDTARRSAVASSIPGVGLADAS